MYYPLGHFVQTQSMTRHHVCISTHAGSLLKKQGKVNQRINQNLPFAIFF